MRPGTLTWKRSEGRALSPFPGGGEARPRVRLQNWRLFLNRFSASENSSTEVRLTVPKMV